MNALLYKLLFLTRTYFFMFATGHRPNLELAYAIDTVVMSSPPLFQGETGRDKTAALMVAIADRESGLNNEAVGDHGLSVCAFQILGGSKKLLKDPLACTRKAYEMLAWSVRYCPRYPVAGYARGPRACTSERAQKISNDRMWLAKEISR